MLSQDRPKRYGAHSLSKVHLVTEHANEAKLLVGVLTTRHRHKRFSGNHQFYEGLCKKVRKRGGLLYVFTPEGLQEHSIEGYTFLETNNKWVKQLFPYPNIVYNRVPTRKEEQMKKTQQILQHFQQAHIPYFNPHFFNKWDMYQALVQNSKLAKHLPKTKRFTSPSDLRSMLEVVNSLYVKPINGCQGKGILRLKQLKTETFLFEDHHQKQLLSLLNIIDYFFPSLHQVILQEAIPLMTLKNRPYDFRVHMHKTKGRWQQTGIGVRCGKIDGITTHVHQGGSILPIEEIEPKPDFEQIKVLAETICEQLDPTFGPLAECSLDIGRDIDSHYWIFEVNAKPMTFDEPDIQENILTSLTNIFFEWCGIEDANSS
ncbi:YheC/YheD family endospore coat-associated protein [Halalkalibacterium ligniniphilum]|uniref:YheC/YheD family endospore coat-associated protein n=1 Tax=Halalkalibacterium ligniniphilum TaxID=1134413 RepID=UPI00034793F7|nr:YheC/YheD family protein [Halalkalibacterium ligniniphilum]